VLHNALRPSPSRGNAWPRHGAATINSASHLSAQSWSLRRVAERPARQRERGLRAMALESAPRAAVAAAEAVVTGGIRHDPSIDTDPFAWSARIRLGAALKRLGQRGKRAAG
jgi:hypothetical protein